MTRSQTLLPLGQVSIHLANGVVCERCMQGRNWGEVSDDSRMGKDQMSVLTHCGLVG